MLIELVLVYRVSGGLKRTRGGVQSAVDAGVEYIYQSYLPLYQREIEVDVFI